MSSKPRVYDIDRVKGVAIFLVVVGHLLARGTQPEGADWYLYLHNYIYKFHMPLFMYTSGFVFFYTYDKYKPATISDYWSFAAVKLRRLMPAYIIFGLIILFGKMMMANIIHVDGARPRFLADVVDILIYPSRSAAGSLWYIYTLLGLYLLAPIFLKVANGKYYLLLVFTFILHFIPVGPYFMADRVLEYSLYFTLGIIAVDNYGVYIQLLKQYSYIFMLVFILSFLSINYLSAENSKLLIGLCSIPAFHSLMFTSFLKDSKILLTLAKYTFSIYLMNTIFIGLVKGVMFEFMSWNGNNFIVFSLVLTMSGILFPIAVKKYIFSRVEYFNRMTN